MRGGAGGLAELAGELPRAERAERGQCLDRQRLIESLHRPLQGCGESVPCLDPDRHWCLDVLGLAATPVRGHDHLPGDGIGYLCPVVTAQDVQGEVGGGGVPGRG